MRFLRRLIADFSGRYDILAYARREHRANDLDCEWYAFLPSEIYPATLLRILQARESRELPEELIDPTSPAPEGVARYYLKIAKSLPEEAFDLDLSSPARASALELARLWSLIHR